MGTKTLNDIHKDIKQLISTITAFEENEEGFRICESFALSNIKHHRYLSVNSYATKEAIREIAQKFLIHGKYDVAMQFQNLVDQFLKSYNFEKHLQYDLQWSLLTLLLDLSTETHKSEVESTNILPAKYTLNATVENDVEEQFDWAQYLQEGQEDFFHNYKSDSESDWSDDKEEESATSNICLATPKHSENLNDDFGEMRKGTENTIDKLSQVLTEEVKSRQWLISNVQHAWWNELEHHKYPIDSYSPNTNLCEIWHEAILKSAHIVNTISEYQVCRELLWMFHVPTEMVLFRKDTEADFSTCSDISIPSLTTIAFKSILSSFCKCFSMLHEIEQFGAELYIPCEKSGLHKKPPLTYEVYDTAIKRILFQYKEDILTIEQNVMKQENNYTLLYLSKLLMKHMNGIKIFYEVHRKSILDWKVHPNWKCASKLLSSIYFEMQNAYCQEKVNICAHLYLSSLSVYLNIIDTWLSEGRLEDWREEFIIARTITPTEVTQDKQNESFTLRTLDGICMADPIMQLLSRKVQYMGCSIELLVSLDRITDMWKINMENDDTRISLNDEFHKKLQCEISKYSFSESFEGLHVTELEKAEKPLEECNREIDVDLEESIVQQLAALNNPFLLKAFEEYIPSKLSRNSTGDSGEPRNRSTQSQKLNLFENLECMSQCVLPTIRKILEKVLSEILHCRYNSAAKLVKSIMTEEYKLELHLKLMRSVYTMEAGHVMNRFYQMLFNQIESDQMWNNSYFLSCILEETLSQQWPESSSRWSIAVSDVSTHVVPQAVDGITLHYAIGWPISIVLNEKTLSRYNEIFRFLLKLKWALWTLNNLRFSDLEGLKPPFTTHRVMHFQIRRLESLRFWLLHAIGSIHSYLSGQVLQSLGFILDKALAQADSLDAIVLVHNEYLERVHEHCLLTKEFEDITTTVNNLIGMCIHIRDKWEYKKLVHAVAELDTMESTYIKYHTYLALALHNAVQHKDADYLTGLSSAFNCSMPCT